MPANEAMDAGQERSSCADVAAQAGLVLRNAALVADLRDSRRRIVAAQDERARKLERNIHDGAQQQLVALAVKLRPGRADGADRRLPRADDDGGGGEGRDERRAREPPRSRPRHLSSPARGSRPRRRPATRRRGRPRSPWRSTRTGSAATPKRRRRPCTSRAWRRCRTWRSTPRRPRATVAARPVERVPDVRGRRRRQGVRSGGRRARLRDSRGSPTGSPRSAAASTCGARRGAERRSPARFPRREGRERADGGADRLDAPGPRPGAPDRRGRARGELPPRATTTSVFIYGGIALVLGYGGVGALISSRHPRNAIGWLFGAIATGFADHGVRGRVRHPRPRDRVRHDVGAARVAEQLGLRDPAGGRPAGAPALPERAPAVSAMERPALGDRRPGRDGGARLHRLPRAARDARGLPSREPHRDPIGAVARATCCSRWAASGSLAAAIASLIALIVRFRRSSGDERQQIRWLAYVGLVGTRRDGRDVRVGTVRGDQQPPVLPVLRDPRGRDPRRHRDRDPEDTGSTGSTS